MKKLVSDPNLHDPNLQAGDVLIIPALAAINKREVLRELAAAVCARQPELAPEKVRAALESREELGSTGIGDGVAIPHAKLAALTEEVLVCGRSDQGIAFGSPDGRPVHLFFLLLAPTRSGSAYLARLAELARFLRDHQTVSRLLQAESREEIAAIIQPE